MGGKGEGRVHVISTNNLALTNTLGTLGRSAHMPTILLFPWSFYVHQKKEEGCSPVTLWTPLEPICLSGLQSQKEYIDKKNI